MAFTRDGTRIATGSYDTSCRLWRVPDLVPIGISMEQRGHVWDIAFNPAGTLLAVGRRRQHGPGLGCREI